MNKKVARLRRAKRSREHMKELGVTRLVVHRSLQHIYAQIIEKDRVLTSACTKSLKCTYGGNISAASEVGKAIAEKAKALGITKVAFDRSGFKYHGRVKALAEAARDGGLDF
ncbi:MAG: 50S ribosomal protein L18 [Gammaproteobacteria bacterium]